MADSSNSDHQDYECPVCLEILRPEIYQCNNGHLLCHKCIPELQKCPICRQELPRKRVRNLEVERLVLKRKFPCPNHNLGCTAKLMYEFIEDHQIDCLFTVINFCEYLGIFMCNDNTSAADFVVHLMGKHKLVGDFVPEGTTLEICQSGALPRDIQCGKVQWRPNFIVQGDDTFFLQTKVTSFGISWMVSSLGSTEVANNFTATIKLISSNANQESTLTWQGQVCGLKSKFEENPNVFCVSFLQTRLFWKKDDQNELVSLKLHVSITKKGDETPPKTEVVILNNPAHPSDHTGAHALHHPAGLTVHENVGCDGCHANPLMGPRYKCIECQDFDLCKDCVDQNVHSHHVFLRASGADMVPKLEQARRAFGAVAAGTSFGNDTDVSYEEGDWTDIEEDSDMSNDSDSYI